MNKNFAEAYRRTIANEGLYSNDKTDRGGETWKGISRVSWPDWEGWPIVDDIKAQVPNVGLSRLEELVQLFYKANFYDVLNLDQLIEIEIICELFDTAVNQGVNIATICFQSALNLLNDGGNYYPDINIDGNIGAKTIAAFYAYMKTSSLPGRSIQRNVKTLLICLNGLQFERYKHICEANPSQEKFFYGWINRCTNQ